MKCKFCGKDIGSDPFGYDECFVCGREVCNDCSIRVGSLYEDTVYWDILCDSNHVCKECLKTTFGYAKAKELYDVDKTYQTAVKEIVDVWKEEVLAAGEQRTPAAR